jgi:predicted Zn-dependent protease
VRFTVTILNSPGVNAFALPDGQLFVTRGLLALVNDNAEMAAIMAHEMAHVVVRHADQRTEQMKTAMLVSRVVSDVVGDKQAAQRTLVASALSLASFSRQQELEADHVGIRNAARAGFDPYGAARFLESMDRTNALRAAMFHLPAEMREGTGFLRTHPSAPERLALSVSTARQYAAPGLGERDANSFLSAIDGIVYGDEVQQGVIRGRGFIHPSFGFTFMAPEGFALENSQSAVLGVSADGRALRFDTVKVAPLLNLSEALTASAAKGLLLEKVEACEINGFACAQGFARSPGWSFRIVLVRFGGAVYRFIFAASEISPAMDEAFLASVRSFRRLSSEEASVTKPYRIRIKTAEPGDTLDRYAAMMPPGERQMEQFLVLNGLDRNAVLAAGTKLKIIAE